MNAKVCGHHCVFVCSPNLGARVPLQGENLYGGRELVDMQLPLGFRSNSRIRPLKENDQCTETSGDSSVTTVSWMLGCSKPPKYLGLGIYMEFWFALPIPILRLSMSKLTSMPSRCVPLSDKAVSKLAVFFYSGFKWSCLLTQPINSTETRREWEFLRKWLNM